MDLAMDAAIFRTVRLPNSDSIMPSTSDMKLSKVAWMVAKISWHHLVLRRPAVAALDTALLLVFGEQ
jgi:hypothetical protein